ncbi:MAG: hypothetical protein KKD05_00035 [Candidatus Omnitrophica bacterium]|nr:hypothetical protein [Candidatus Omnitrophota bacterium]
MEKSITSFAKQKIKSIHLLSQELNTLEKKEHMQVLLELMREHVQEIKELYQQKDKHYITETGDLLILCLEILKESDQDYDQIMNRCYERYINKISVLTNEFKNKRSENE